MSVTLTKIPAHPRSVVGYTVTLEKVDRRIADAESYVTTRFFPPLPRAYGALAVQAVDLVNGEAGGVLIPLPTDLQPVPRLATDGHVRAVDLVDCLRLWHLIDGEA